MLTMHCRLTGLPDNLLCATFLKIQRIAEMKIPRTRKSHGFTLVELLVVIVIVASLAALSIGGALHALATAKKTTAAAAARAVESAVNSFFTEYGSMPDDGTATADTTVKTDAAEGKKLLEILLGMESTVNTRSIKFLNVQEGKSKMNGLIYTSDGKNVDGLYDPWGGPYNVRLDIDGDEKIQAQTAADASATTLNGRRVAVWSNGADGVKATGKAGDDVKTW